MTIRLACILVSPGFRPGDPPPSGYLQRQEWADVQHKAGLRQEVCSSCCRYKFPQELSETVVNSKAKVIRGGAVHEVTVNERLCLSCAARREGKR